MNSADFMIKVNLWEVYFTLNIYHEFWLLLGGTFHCGATLKRLELGGSQPYWDFLNPKVWLGTRKKSGHTIWEICHRRLSLRWRNGDSIKRHCFDCRDPFLHEPSAPAAIMIFFCPCDKRIFFSVLSRLVQKLEGIYYFLLRSDFEKFILPIPINDNILNKTQYDLGFGTDGWTNELLRM